MEKVGLDREVKILTEKSEKLISPLK